MVSGINDDLTLEGVTGEGPTMSARGSLPRSWRHASITVSRATRAETSMTAM